MEVPEDENIKAYTTRVESGIITGPKNSVGNNLTLNVKNEYENISSDGNGIDRYQLLKEEGYSHGFLLEEASISVTCEITDSHFQQQPKASRFGREVPHNTNVFPNKKRSPIYDSESSSRFLEDAFKANSYPTSKERHIIAKKCGLSPTQVGAWFTNRRNISR
ncbi:unnamed protein product [Debaryomyces fabryi]|nr:unnamed protein product [Debaryomyces fabryi]